MQNQYRNEQVIELAEKILQMSSVDPIRQGAEERIKWRHGRYIRVSKSNLKMKSWHLT